MGFAMEPSHPRAPGMAAEPRLAEPLALHPPAHHQDALGGVTPKIVALWGHGMQQKYVSGAERNAWGQWAALRNPGSL